MTRYLRGTAKCEAEKHVTERGPVHVLRVGERMEQNAYPVREDNKLRPVGTPRSTAASDDLDYRPITIWE